jgi:putative multiple sugar transport system permease protein
MGVLIGVYTFIMNRTTIGRRIYAVGGNAKAARLSGVSVPAVSFLTFVNMGILAALAGLIFAARLNSGTPKAGTGFELDVIAACFIGGASASGGVRNEQRHVHHGYRRGLSAGHQGDRSARSRVRRRVQQE